PVGLPLLEQEAHRELQLLGELGGVRFGHVLNLLLGGARLQACAESLNHGSRAFMMRRVARSVSIPVISVSSSVARSASASIVVTPFDARTRAVWLSMPSMPRRS